MRKFVVGVVALAFLMMLGARWIGAPIDVVDPSGYVAHANRLITEGKIALDCDTAERALRGDRRDSILVRVEPGSDDEQWLLHSYLVTDIRRFQENPDAAPGPFLIEGCTLIGVDPYYHRVALPYHAEVRWTGDIRLTGGGVVATVENSARNQLIEIRQPPDTLAADSSTVVVPGRSGVTSTPWARLQTPTHTFGAELFFVGPQLVFTDARETGASSVIRVNGYDMPLGRTLRLDSGDWLHLTLPSTGRDPARRPATQTFVATTGQDTRVVSLVRVQNRHVERVFLDQPLRPFLQPLGQVMDATLQELTSGPADSVNLQLTIDRKLSAGLRDSLLPFCGRRGPEPTGRGPRAVSMIVLDAFAGSVRALPSCPEAAQLQPYDRTLTARERERWLHNKNLQRHPIGSAGKPFWAAAVASAYPNLVDVEIPAHPAGVAEQLGGCALSPGYFDHAHGRGGWVGMEEFLALSCNRYVVEMATASLVYGGGAQCRQALSADRVRECFPAAPASSDSLRICDRLVRLVLAPQHGAIGERCNELRPAGGINGSPAVADFRSITNVQTYNRGTLGGVADQRRYSIADEYRYQLYRSDVWRTLFDSLALRDDTASAIHAGLRFAAVSPEAANIALNSVTDLRRGWINRLIGGSEAMWSNFELAEAMARLMTGRSVRGTLVDALYENSDADPAVASGETARLFPDSVLLPGIRRRVLYGMSRVIDDPAGTARLLHGPMEQLAEAVRRLDPQRAYELYWFAKTGTPSLEVPYSTHQDSVVRFAVDRGIRWNAADSTFLWRATGLTRADSAWFDRAILDPIRRAPGEYASRAGEGAQHPLTLDGAIVRYHPVAAGRVVRQGGVLILGLLAVPAEAGRAAARREPTWISACPNPALAEGVLGIPTAASLQATDAVGLTVAAYVDDLAVGQGSHWAVDLVASTMPALGDYLTRDIRRRQLRAHDGRPAAIAPR